jgi:hypothetical protein
MNKKEKEIIIKFETPNDFFEIQKNIMKAIEDH